MYFCFRGLSPDASRQNTEELFSYHEQKLLSGNGIGENILQMDDIKKEFFFMAHPVSYFSMFPSVLEAAKRCDDTICPLLTANLYSGSVLMVFDCPPSCVFTAIG